MHASDVVLQAFVTMLSDIPGLEDHVVTDEEKIAKIDDLRWAWVNLGDENIVAETTQGKKTRGLFINVDVLVAARYQAMQAANDLSGLIEDRIDVDRTLGGIAGTVVLQGLTRGRNDDALVARTRLTFLVTLWTRAGAASTPV